MMSAWLQMYDEISAFNSRLPALDFLQSLTKQLTFMAEACPCDFHHIMASYQLAGLT